MKAATVYSKEQQPQHPDEDITWGISFLGCLATGETLEPSDERPLEARVEADSEEQPETMPELGEPFVNVASFKDGDGRTVDVGKGVMIRVYNVPAEPKGQVYKITVSCGTSSSNRKTVVNRLESET